jgi:uncharacterized Ntn-hydrolase superfamily protein
MDAMASGTQPVATFSLVAFDPEAQAWGVAVASKFPAVGAVVPWAQAGAGAVATQSYANTRFGPEGLARMQSGRTAQETLAELLADDPERAKRQVGLVDAQGRAATYTGEECLEWAGGRIGKHYAAQGNLLVGPQVVETLSATFERSTGDLPDRLLAALSAGDEAGGDRRGRQSAALYVARAGSGYAGFNDRWIDYRVDDDTRPIRRLRELLELHRLYFEQSPPEDKLPLEGEVARRLTQMLQQHAGFGGEASGQLDSGSLEALRAFIGRENLEDRVDFHTRLIDRPVFDFLLRRFPD